MARIEALRPPAESLGSRLEFETLIADTSAVLFKVAPDQLDLAVEQALDRVRAFFNADRCALLSVSADQQVINVRLAAYAAGIAPVSPEVNLAPLFPWARYTTVVERAIVRVPRMADLLPTRRPTARRGTRCRLDPS